MVILVRFDRCDFYLKLLQVFLLFSPLLFVQLFCCCLSVLCNSLEEALSNFHVYGNEMVVRLLEVRSNFQHLSSYLKLHFLCRFHCLWIRN